MSRYSKKILNKASIQFRGFIGEGVNTVDELNYQLMFVGDNEMIQFEIDSDGGVFTEALRIFNRLKSHKGKKKAIISPIAASAAALITLCADEIFIPENGLMRFHLPIVGDIPYSNSDDLMKVVDQLKVVEDVIIGMLSTRLKKSEEECRAFLKEDRWLSATEAKELGLVDQILPLSRKKVDISNLELPDNILAFVVSKNSEVQKMELKDILNSCGIKFEDSETEEDLSQKIVNAVQDLQKKVKDATPPKKEEKKTLPESILNIVIRGREIEIDNLLKEGKITSAVSSDLKKTYCAKDTISVHIDDEGNSTDFFEPMIKNLSGMEKVLDYEGTRRRLPKEGESKEEPPIVSDAKRRAEAAKARR